jgi:hypothetical protein
MKIRGFIFGFVQDHVSSGMNRTGTCRYIDTPLTQRTGCLFTARSARDRRKTAARVV